jgi:DNA-binding NtrC family response regulator
MELVTMLYAERWPARRLAIATNGLCVRSALVVARQLPDDIIIREKGTRGGVFDSILHEAETGETADEPWNDDVTTFSKAGRQFARRILVHSGYNRSEAARRLGVHRSTMVRYTDPNLS